MAATLPNGSQIAIASTFGASKTMSVLTNAAEAVATLEAAHGVVENDIIVLTSGWPRANGKVVRADSVATNDVTLEDFDTQNTTTYPAGSGTGSVREITAWQAITGVLGFSQSGGDNRNTTFQFLEEHDERSLPTGVSAKRITLNLVDDQTLAWWTVLRAASAAKTEYPFRLTLPSGAIIYMNGVWHFDETPTLNTNQVMSVTATIDLVPLISRYTA